MGQYINQHLDNNTLTGITLSTAYDGTGSITVGTAKKEKAELLVSYTMPAGESANTVNIKIETGPTTTDLYRHIERTQSGNESVSTASDITLVGNTVGENRFAIPLDVQNTYMKVSLKETGVAGTAGTASVKVMLSGR